MSKNSKTIVLAAGGTGGHIFPAQALCAKLLEKGFRPFMICDERTRKFLQKPLSEIEKYEIISSKLSGSLIQKIIGMNLLAISCLMVTVKLFFLRPNYVIGFGGYPSFPTLFAATILRIPFFIHEQNSVMGRVNKIFAKYAKMVFLSFPETQGAMHENSVVTGNFVRESVIKARKIPRKDSKFHILVIGGSQGANILSTAVPKAVAMMPKTLQNKIYINQQSRLENLEESKKLYSQTYAEANVQEFFTNIGSLLMQADVVICRSGASTVWEVIALNKPAILVPYKHAKDNHQFYNAKYLSDNKAGILIEESDLVNCKKLSRTLEELIKDDSILRDLKSRARKLVINTQEEIFKYIS